MKRLYGLAICIIMTMALLTACGNKKTEKDNDNKENNKVTIDVVKTADTLLNDVKFDAEMSVVEDMEFFLQYFGVEAEDVVEQKTYISAGLTADIISAIKCKDEASAKTVKERFEAYTKDLSSQYADYKPEECGKLDKPVIKVYGEYVIVCTSNDNDTATKTIEGQVK